jgi:hypothetical protein
MHVLHRPLTSYLAEHQPYVQDSAFREATSLSLPRGVVLHVGTRTDARDVV